MTFKWAASGLLSLMLVGTCCLVDANTPIGLDEPWLLRLTRRWSEHPIRLGVAGFLVGMTLMGLRGSGAEPETAPEGNPDRPRA